MDTNTISGQDARLALLRGVNQIANCVKKTLGPMGRNCIIENKNWYYPTATNDGVTIAQCVTLPDSYENMGGQLLLQVADQTNDSVGDGTTTSIIMAQSLIETAMKYLQTGCDQRLLLKGMQKAVDFTVDYLQKQTISINTPAEIEAIATVSGGEEKIGALIRSAYEKVGMHGVIQLELGERQETVLDFCEGIKFNKGFISPQMVNDVPQNRSLLKQPYILVTDDEINYIYQITSILEKIFESKRPLLIIAEDISADLLAVLLQNSLKGTMEIVVVTVPGYGERRQAYLDDIAVITGATVVAEARELSLEQADCSVLGMAESIIIEKNATTIIGGAGDKEQIKAYTAALAAQIELRNEGWTKDKMWERLGWLKGGIANIKVGAPTELAAKELYYRIEDALNSARSAVGNGILPGGGIAFLAAADELAQLTAASEEEQWGMNIVRESLRRPLLQLAENCGKNPFEIYHQIRELPSGYGYDAKNDEYRDMLAAGIVDAAEVEIQIMTNAFSVATILLSTDGLIAYQR
ncbi:molecular chaperone GroEL [Desulfitobacterium sp.]|uniref:Hsp60 family chaperonin n=1 Tax=Desulfitobacterium sp. TaxID=49981 RepID=UPI002B1F5035|nr:molecular chaperone GroEL [Desulfitobacterium sp.]MEA4901608.1 molecular chaperone GroEL [Desulfitobacterium sp.]